MNKTNKKLIAGITTKNEEWIVGKTLKALSSFCDRVVVYDDGSTDSTEKICKSFENVDWYIRPEHDPLVREEAKQRLELIGILRNYDPEMVLLLDADEIPTPSIVNFINNCDDSTSWKVRMINLWGDESAYRCDSYTTPTGVNVNFDPFLDNSWAKYPLMKFDKNFNYNYDLTVQKGGCSQFHPSPENLPGKIGRTDDFYVIHYGTISKNYLDGSKHEFYSKIEEKWGKGSYETRLQHHKDCSRPELAKTNKTNPDWFW